MATSTSRMSIVISLTLSEEEAYSIRTVIGNLSTLDVSKSVRKHTDPIYDLLGKGFCGNSPFPDLENPVAHTYWEDPCGGIHITPSAPSYRKL